MDYAIPWRRYGQVHYCTYTHASLGLFNLTADCHKDPDGYYWRLWRGGNVIASGVCTLLRDAKAECDAAAAAYLERQGEQA